ncbi:hypothetical protein E2C01_000753 [Portunus trituberculatus]|uniref:Uncharacterized protein n=1 Tax=Portunus trituberculatus TaxID=210409 RepID=A0A5B7CIG5_PORTR|nr:hypothetical protein [Portunus trituberculatus]
MNLEEREREKVLRDEAKEKMRKDKDREKDFLPEGSGYETKEVVSMEERRDCGGVKKSRVTCIDIDGLLSSMLEVKDYLKEKNPDVMCIVETKLRAEIHVNFKEGYNNWRRNRKVKREEDC